jgi:eukaryotic-like serine/threonine-protein kinase
MQTNENSLVGKTLRNKYQIDEVLSADIQGGQGKVYFAIDTTASIEKKYILKQFTPNYNDTFFLEVGSRLFKQEAKILQRLGSHSQIPQILDYFEENEQFFLVQEWIDGQNLQQEINSKQHLTETETIDLLKDVLEVLSFVHQNNCIHRDIKPANLIRNKYDRKIFLIDFGAVKEKIRRENIDSSGNFTQTVGIGTSGYTPTEQWRGTPKFCSDIFALGMVAIQALTGKSPKELEFDDRHNPLWQQHLPPGDRNYNSNLLKIIDRMVPDYHQERYQSAGEVLQDLQQIHFNLEPLERRGDPTIPDGKIIRSKTTRAKKSLLAWVVVSLGTITAVIIGIAIGNTEEKYVAYSDPNYGVELEIPQDWVIQKEDDFLKPGIIFLSSEENSTDDFQERVKVAVENLSSPLSLNEYTQQAVREIETSNSIIEPPQDITIANRPGKTIIYQGKDGMRRLEVWTLKNQKAYIATYTAEADKFDKFLTRADKIIKSISINQ